MKKSITVFVIVLIIVGVVLFFGGYKIGTSKNAEFANNVSKINEEENKLNSANDAVPIEITLNNWQDYIELEDIEESSVDDFGEIISTGKYTILKFKESVKKHESVMLKLKYNDEVSIGENWREQNVKIYDGSDNFKINYKLNVKNNNVIGSKDYDGRVTKDNFEVVNAKGRVYIKLEQT